jgi:hypothetical protein
MPLHDLGYRHWEEEPVRQSYSWLAISRYGIRLAWKSSWIRRVVFLSFFPAIALAVFIFLFEQINEWPEVAGFVLAGVPAHELIEAGVDAGVISREDLANERSIRSGTRSSKAFSRRITAAYVDSHRTSYWSQLVLAFFQRGLWLVVLLFGMITPRLISHDVQSRAFLLYFSRPITPFQYVLGKATTTWAFLAAVTTLPALLCYFSGILVSPSLDVVFSTWMIPFRILLATVVIGLPTTMLALWLSSLARESRYAAFGWFAIWMVGLIAAVMLAAAEYDGYGPAAGNPFSIVAQSRWAHVSFTHVLSNSLGWVFGMASLDDVKWFLLELVLITGVTFKLLMKRVVAPIQI